MTVVNLLQNLNKAGVTLKVKGDSLEISAAKNALTAELLSQLKLHKADIIQRLSEAKINNNEQLPNIEPDQDSLFESFPLSDLQQGFYMADNAFMAFQVRPHFYIEMDRENLDIDRYRDAWNKMLLRHKNNIAVTRSDGELHVVKEQPKIVIKLHDFREMSVDQATVQKHQLRFQLMREELPLDSWPWVTLHISLWTENASAKARIHYNSNNFYLDGFSIRQIFYEVSEYYVNPSFNLPALTLSFRDAALALKKLQASSLGEASKDYWLSRLNDLPPPPQIPQNIQMDRRVRSNMQRQIKLFPADVWEQFKKNAALHKLMPSSAMTAAYACVLETWSNSQHFILGNMASLRFSEMHPEINQTLGNFATIYPLEIDFREKSSFAQRAINIQNQMLNDAKHQYFGGMQVMQELNRLKGELGNSPCPFVVGSALSMGQFEEYTFSCLETPQTLLDHTFWELKDGRLCCAWDFLEEFFPEGIVKQMWEAYTELLTKLALDPALWEVGAFDLLQERELEARQLCNSSAVSLPLGLLHQGLDNAAKNRGQSLALKVPQDALSYQGLSQWSSAIASRLKENGIGANQAVAIVADRGIQLLAAVFGILRAGAFYVPIDPELPEDRIHFVLSNCEAAAVLTQQQYAENKHWPETVKVHSVDSFRNELHPAISAQNNSPEDLAYIIYTSGSTGHPKGVMIDHRGALNTVLDINQRFNVTENDKIFGVSSFGFDLSVYDIFGAIAAGATLIYPDPKVSLNPAHWLERVISEQVTIWNSVPALMNLLVDSAQRQKIRLPSLRLVLLSGDWIPIDLPGNIKAIAPNAQIISLGGATEASIWSIYYPIENVGASWASIPYGFPLANQRWHIRDVYGRDVPAYVTGDLYIAGVGLAKGYWHDQEKTNQSFIHDETTGEMLYRTGDQGRYLADGCIEFLGRVDFQVKIQGNRIELGEIETKLLEHPRVKEAIVSAQKTPDQKQQQLVAYIVSIDTANQVESEELTAWLQETLPRYMVPANWAFFDQLPMTSNGKIDRKALSNAKATTTEANLTEHLYIAPRNAAEQKLAVIWGEVLEISKIGVMDDFFEIGGQSFGAVRVLAMIKEQFGTMLSLADIWQGRTIESLAICLDSDAKAAQNQKILTAIDTQGEGGKYFWVHPAGGHTICYLELAKRLNHPVYGFQAQGVDGVLEPLLTVEAMAHRYVSEMRLEQRHGPYLIGGWSSGAVIAFEMAAQLERLGEEVEQLVLVDSPTPHKLEGLDEEKLLFWFLEDLGRDLPLSLIKDLQFNQQQMLSKAIELLTVKDDYGLDAEQLEPVFKVFKSIVKAIQAYRPKQISADILIVRASEGTVSEFKNHPDTLTEDWGWKKFTAGKVICKRFPGSHYTLLNMPNVDAVANLVNDCVPRESKDDQRAVSLTVFS